MQADESKLTDETAPASAKPRDPLVGTTLDERFRIEELIGSGGMSNVYRAVQLRVNRDVAIKTLKVQVDSQPVYRERFQREVNLLCALSHPNIVTVYDCLIGPDGQPCVVMDYLRGRSLEQLLQLEGTLNIDRFARIFVQVCSALDYAHRKGVVHRDIKPGNIVMLDNEMDFVKVVDFGLAKFSQESRRLTHTGELWGSPPYMSPEQCMGKPDNERSDVYSLGIVMYEMLTGKDPFHTATSIFELIQCHASKEPPAFRDTAPDISVPPALEEVVFKAMAKDPEQRYQTANELKDALVAACMKTSGVSNISFDPSRPSSTFTTRAETPSGETRNDTVQEWLNQKKDLLSYNETAAEASESGPLELEICPNCGKPIQKQRRGSMTSWILADHHKVMEKISGACMCQSQNRSGEIREKTAVRPADTGDTGMQLAKILARQSGGTVPGADQQFSGNNTAGGSANSGAYRGQLFQDERASNAKSNLRFKEVSGGSIFGNQLLIMILSLAIVAGIVFGAIQIISNMRSQKIQETQSSAEIEKQQAREDGKEGEEKPDQQPAPKTTKSEEAKRTTSKSTPPRRTRAVTRAQAPARAARPAARPAAKPATSKKPADKWEALDKLR